MKRFLLILLFIIFSCDSGNLSIIMDIPLELREASGLEINKENTIFWMINDSGNKPILYGLNKEGGIIKQIKINAKNRDWEDLTMDPSGNIYIGDFGNNGNDSKNLSIFKISKDSLNNSKSVDLERISFVYPEQTKFPPKKEKHHFDCESFFFYNDSLYLFTKSRTHKERGKTNLYQIPAKAGNYKAKFINSFTTCNNRGCWVTSADINDEGNLMALLTEHSVFIFSKFKNNDFLDGEVKQLNFNHNSQKESVCFKNDSTLYITDEYVGISGGNLYEFIIE